MSSLLLSPLACDDGGAASTRLDRGMDPADAAVADRGAGGRPDMYRGDGPYGTGVFVHPPPVIDCFSDALAVREDLMAGFAAVPFGTGVATSFFDVDRNGVDEMFVWDGGITLEEALADPLRRNQIISAYERVDGVWVQKYQMLSFKPRGLFDLDGDGVLELVGLDYGDLRDPVDPEVLVGYVAVPGVRRHVPGGRWAWDERLAFFATRNSSGDPVPTFKNAARVSALDVDGDGRPEVGMPAANQLLEWDGAEFVKIFDGLDDPVFGDRYVDQPGNIGPLTAGDYDGDGFGEVVFGAFGPWVWRDAEAMEGETYHEHGRWLEARGDNTFVDLGRLPLGTSVFAFASSGDVTGDGIDDLLIGNGTGCQGFQLYTTTGNDGLRLAWSGFVLDGRGFSGDEAATLADVDGDGDMEMVANMSQVLTVWDWVADANHPSGGTMQQIFGERICEPPCSTVAVRAGDVDGDGRAEFVTYDSGYRVTEGVDEIWQSARGVIMREMVR
ncbi:MAG: VCBS repeat-containing protein [Myxococcales bacterium]|nr:VCBS repeat-containing protein [Myxococcales bacterium]